MKPNFATNENIEAHLQAIKTITDDGDGQGDPQGIETYGGGGMMVRAFLVFVYLLISPNSGIAQDASVDRSTVEMCFVSLKNGAPLDECVGAESNQCQMVPPHGSTTMGITRCLNAETEIWQQLLDQEFDSLMSRTVIADRTGIHHRPKRVDALTQMHTRWIEFREAQCRYKFALQQDGTIRSNAWAACQLSMTARRTIELSAMNEGKW